MAGGQGVAGSNPAVPTQIRKLIRDFRVGFLASGDQDRSLRSILAHLDHDCRALDLCSRGPCPYSARSADATRALAASQPGTMAVRMARIKADPPTTAIVTIEMEGSGTT